jgi:5-methylthioadenosine/S-adenosylhomocysteine deaminase
MGVDFAVNIDRLSRPPSDQVYLEVKARTWSKRDAYQKAELISELLNVLGVDKTGLVKDPYVAL